jgi:hypothetical protein
MELAAALPPEIGSPDRRYQNIEWQFKNEEVNANVVIKPYALQAIEQLASRETIVLKMGQSHINDTVAWWVRPKVGNG